MFRGRLVCVTCALFFDQKWRRNAPVRNAPFTQRDFHRSLRSASPAHCRNGPVSQVVASGAIRRSTRRGGARGAPTSADGLGNVSTSGDSLARPRSVARSIAASGRVALPHEETARSTTSRHATATATGRAVITISSPMSSVSEVSRCCAVHTMRRSPRRRPPRAPRHGGRPSWPVKLRSSRGVS
jgi:hypothetical protein